MKSYASDRQSQNRFSRGTPEGTVKACGLGQAAPNPVLSTGCPPSADRIRAVLEPLLAGEMPHLEGQQIKFVKEETIPWLLKPRLLRRN